MEGILPSPLAISPPHSQRSQGCQRSPLCRGLWTSWMNAQANHCITVDARGCGKVDNRTAQSGQAAQGPSHHLAAHQVTYQGRT
jgi:hypothetical protein